MPKYSEVARHVQELREMADFMERYGVAMPDFWMSHTLHVGLTDTNYERNPETDEYETTINEEGTKENIRKFLACVGACEKDYREDKLVITKNYSDGRQMVVGTVDRSIACKKVVKGTKLVPAQLIQAKMEEEVEWVCDEGLSLLKLVQ